MEETDVTLNWLSLAVLLYLALGAVAGWRRGFVAVATSVIGYIVGLLLAAHFQAGITRDIARLLPLRQWAMAVLPKQGLAVAPRLLADTVAWSRMVLAVLVFLIILVVVERVALALGRGITDLVRRIPVVRTANTLGGLVGGLVENMLVVGVVLGLLITLPLIKSGAVGLAVRQSPLSVTLVHWVGALAPWRLERWLT
jgi:uncharacterized membrane protein required for colicin V production